MERAVRLLATDKFSSQILSDDDIARAVWPVAIGKAIATHTSRIRLVRSTLVVEVEDAIWQKQLHALTRQIVDRLRTVMGNGKIQDVEFRIAIPRRQMQRAESSNDGTSQSDEAVEDEAERISDPVLKRVYRLSRKRALA